MFRFTSLPVQDKPRSFNVMTTNRRNSLPSKDLSRQAITYRYTSHERRQSITCA